MNYGHEKSGRPILAKCLGWGPDSMNLVSQKYIFVCFLSVQVFLVENRKSLATLCDSILFVFRGLSYIPGTEYFLSRRLSEDFPDDDILANMAPEVEESLLSATQLVGVLNWCVPTILEESFIY